jgi:purine-binding chemotaxis protein CheW
MPVEIKDTSNIQAGQERRKPATPEAELIQLVVFSIEDEAFGTDINQVREIVRAGSVTPIPDSPHFIKGVTNIRGEIIIVIDLKERFFLPVKKAVESKHIVITGQEGNLYGVLVDEVTEVLRIPRTEIKTTPHLITKIDRTYINGVITLENRLIMLLDLKRVLSEEELNKLARITLSHKESRTEEPVSEESLPGQASEEPKPKSPTPYASKDAGRSRSAKERGRRK